MRISLSALGALTLAAGVVVPLTGSAQSPLANTAWINAKPGPDCPFYALTFNAEGLAGVFLNDGDAELDDVGDYRISGNRIEIDGDYVSMSGTVLRDRIVLEWEDLLDDAGRCTFTRGKS